MGKHISIEKPVDANLEGTGGVNSLPHFPKEVYEVLPRRLKALCYCFDKPQEKDIFLMSALAQASVAVVDTNGIYDSDTVYPCFYFYALGPAASGKGALRKTNGLLNSINEIIEARNLKAQSDYDMAMSEKGDKKESETLKPPPKCHLEIPTNTSVSSMIKQLKDNGGVGVILESEGKPLINANKKDAGGLDEVFLKAFHQEIISQYYKTGDGYVSIKCPRLSIAITSTPQQYLQIIGNTEDGQFSRFLHYLTSNTDPVFRDPFQLSDNRVPGLIRDCGQWLAALFLHFEKIGGPHFELQDYQKEMIVEEGQRLKDVVMANDGAHELVASVHRLNLIRFKLCMLLSVLTECDETLPANWNAPVFCSDEVFLAVNEIIEVSWNHLVRVYEITPALKQTAQRRDPALINDLILKTYRQGDIGYKKTADTVNALLGTKLTKDAVRARVQKRQAYASN